MRWKHTYSSGRSDGTVFICFLAWMYIMSCSSLCVINCSGRIYYVVHKLQSTSKVVIHLHGVHKHLVANGKCKETMGETKRRIIEDIDRTHDAKIFVISMSVNKTFLARHLLDDSGDDRVELLDYEKLEQSEDLFFKLSLREFITSLFLSSIVQGVPILITTLN